MKNQISNAIDNIFRKNLDVKKSEKIIVFTDAYNKSTQNIARRVFQSGKKFTGNIKYVEFTSKGYHGTEPPEELWKEAFGENALSQLKNRKLLEPVLAKRATKEQIKEIEKIIEKHKNESIDIAIALSYFSTSHTRFRDLLNRICKTRYASMPLFDEKMLRGAMRVDWGKMEQRIMEMARMVNRYERIEINTPNGTFMTLSKKGRRAMVDTGIITKPGSFSNLPAGEVFIAPLEGTAEGQLVLEWAPTRRLKNPIMVCVENGLATRVEGKEQYVDYLRKVLSKKRENRNIAELGLGTNDKASRADNILESEKIFGTIHIALGDNSSFGGRVSTSFHQDFVFFSPTVTLISYKGHRRTFMKDGRLL